MTSRLFFLSFLSFFAAPILRAEPFLRLIQPFENANLPFLKQSFVFGSVMPASATLTINGVVVKPYTNGGFLTMIPFQEGKFKIEAIATDGVSTTTVIRTVNVAGSVQTYAANHGKLDILSPKTRFVLRPGDTIELGIQGAPNGKAAFRFKSRSEFLPLEEKPGAVQGIYKGVYVVRPDDKFDNDDILFILKRKDGRRITSKADASITVQRRRVPRIIELKEDSVLLTGPDADFGYNLFSLQGTRLEVTGEQGDFLRVAVGETNQGWVKKSAGQELPNGTLLARSVTRNLRVGVMDESTILEIPLQYRHPHRIEQFSNPHHLRLTLYGVVADSDRIRYKSNNSVIEEVTWHQSEPTTCVFDIRTKQDQPWGYDIRYEGTTLVLEIRHRPPYVGKGYSLKGLKVAVDAGHSKENFGTIGPWANTEASITLMVAKVVKGDLEKRGADTVMIQDGTKEISLQERVAIAWRERAHLYISIHADACGEGQDPREVQGYSVHYYHPQSHAFAEAIHEVYGQKTGLRDQGVWRSNLSICRVPQMPSLLLEQAFLILPEYEELMLTPRHHRMVAESIVTGILQFMETHPK